MNKDPKPGMKCVESSTDEDSRLGKELGAVAPDEKFA
jgi:hypothetical protein